MLEYMCTETPEVTCGAVAGEGRRVITGATATPVANSVTEMHVMQRYLRPDPLKAAGIQDFNTWAAAFGQGVEEMELSVAGGDRFKLKSRFAKFQNVSNC